MGIFGEDARSPLLVCSYVYASAALFAAYVHLGRSRIKEHGHSTHLIPARRMRYFPLLLGVCFLSRGAWFVLVHMHVLEINQHDGTYVHERVHISLIDLTIDLYPLGVVLWSKLATVLYVTAFTLLLQFWSDMLSFTQGHRGTAATAPLAQRKRRSNVLVIANVWMYVVELVLLLSEVFTTGTWMINWDGWCCALFFLTLSWMLGYYAWCLRKYFQTHHSYLVGNIAIRVTILGLLCSIFFFLRGLLFVILPQTTSIWYYNAFVELLPSLVVLSMMQVNHLRNKNSVVPTEQTPLISPNHLSV